MAGDGCRCDRLDCHGSGCGVGQGDRAAYPAAVVVAPIASGFGVIVALFWLIRWPTRGQSVLFSLTGSVCIAAACLVQGDPRLGLLGCGAFAVLGGYIAFFTAPRT
jgi:hypothetical protein